MERVLRGEGVFCKLCAKSMMALSLNGTHALPFLTRDGVSLTEILHRCSTFVDVVVEGRVVLVEIGHEQITIDWRVCKEGLVRSAMPSAEVQPTLGSTLEGLRWKSAKWEGRLLVLGGRGRSSLASSSGESPHPSTMLKTVRTKERD